MPDSSPPKSRLPHTGVLLLVAVLLIFAVGVLKIWWPYHLEQLPLIEPHDLTSNRLQALDTPWFMILVLILV